jgi:2-polyprenyl-3-methyl-5-hydroxy-6-metoxy-1,4-benzoquinol methylase
MDSLANLSPKKLSSILRKKNVETDLISKIKISFRPYICPFGDILSGIGYKKKIFDIGCGSGMFLCLCAEFCSPSKLGGIEISQKLVDNTIKLLNDYNISKSITRYDGEDIPTEIKDYDFITLIDVLHHVPKEKQEKFLKRIISQMKPRSRLIIKDIDGGSLLVFFNKIHDYIFSREIGSEKNFKEMEEFLKKKNVRINLSYRKRIFVYPHYFFIVEKK